MAAAMKNRPHWRMAHSTQLQYLVDIIKAYTRKITTDKSVQKYRKNFVRNTKNIKKNTCNI